ncbi:hypothetical protein HBH96_076350 [Parastagonospora nodorum]|nr:hypothetical protein HBH96_076350 [Parastagonospora nodorum]
MLPLTSPRLPGVPILHAQSTGPEFSRWRRSIKFALEAKGTWRYCSGECTMPMPSSPTMSTANLQPSLLEERREWVKHDREVKLDIFLSIAEEVMLELFEVGPPLPPSNMNAQEMLRVLEQRYAVFNFESYHHAFCHFLNLHIDQYSTIEEFNQEFLTTLEELLDHGQPLSNTQACSAYFSKLRCTQNPWVAKKLKEWDVKGGEMDCRELLKESPPWSIIRPLATKASHTFLVQSIPEEDVEDSSASDSDSLLEKSDGSTASSVSSHSRNVSTESAPQKDPSAPERQHSILTVRSQEITIQASPEAIAEMELQAMHKELGKLPTSAIPERGSSKFQVPGTILSDGSKESLPEWLVSKKSVAQRPLPPTDRPLPPLPQSDGEVAISKTSSQTSLPKTISSPKPPTQTPPTLRLETTHPTLRPETSTPLIDARPTLRPSSPTPLLDVHPALRPRPTSFLPKIDTTPLLFPFPSPPLSSQLPSPPQKPSLANKRRPSSTSIPPSRRPSQSTIPWPSTPDIATRPHSSLAALPATQAPNPIPSLGWWKHESQQSHIQSDEEDEECDEEDGDFLPLQGTCTRDSEAWSYLYQAKGGYLITAPGRTITSSSTSEEKKASPTFRDVVLHRKRSSVDFVARLSGESARGEEKDKAKRFGMKKSWIGGVGLGIGRFAGKGVKEII